MNPQSEDINNQNSNGNEKDTNKGNRDGGISDNQRADYMLDEIYDAWSHKSVDEEGEEFHHPISKKEIEFAEDKIEKINNLSFSDDDIALRKEMIEETIDQSYERSFIGSWWIIGGVTLYLLFTLYYAWGDFTYTYSVEQAERVIPSIIKSEENRLARLQEQPPSEQDEEAIEQSEARIDKFLNMDPTEYAEKRTNQRNWNGLKSIFGKLVMSLILVGYFYASMAPQYLIDKRERQLKRKMKGANFLKKAIMGIMGFFISSPWVTIHDVHADGSKSFSEDNLAAGMIQLFWKFGIPILIAVLVISVMVSLLPILTIISYLRNYQNEKVQESVEMAKTKLHLAHA